MTPHYERATELYLELKHEPANAWDRLLADRCNGDDALANEARRLLEADADDSIDQLLDQIRNDREQLLPGETRRWQDAVTTTADPDGATPGEQIGPFRVLERLGEGGFGIVYVAEQTSPVKRRVALKVLRASVDSKKVAARFDAERQMLAMLDHPCIARLLDAGVTDSGRPFFAMELVPGVPITTYCRRAGLGVDDRVRLFLRVCDAVRHAHQRGVIHRDLKPSNILVRTDTDPALPKVIDFGIAKALGQRLEGATVYTEQRQMLGTPEYMSPEQASGTPQEVDTRTDVYALGVVLYELLTGRTPVAPDRIRELSLVELARVIEEEPPTRPSTAARTTLRDGTHATTRTGTNEPIRRELDWILLRALEKSKERRYASVDDLASDLRRYLGGDAIDAAPPSAAYRALKLVHRHRTGAIILGAIALALVIGIGSITYTLIRTTSLLDRAELAEAEARIAADLAADRADSLARLAYAGLLWSADEAIRFGHRDRALERLDACSEERRGPEWHWTHARLHPEHSIIQHSEADPARPDRQVEVRGVRFTPDGRRLASVSNDGTGRVWDSATGRAQTPIMEHGAYVLAVDVSPDGTRIASAGGDGQRVWLWDAISGDAIADNRGHITWVTSVRFSPDGRHLATCSDDSSVRIWDAESLDPVAVLHRHIDGVFGIAWRPDGTQLASVANDGLVILWDTTTWQPQHELELAQSGADAVVFTPDGSILITGGEESRITFWDPDSGTRLRSVRAATDAILALAVSPDGQLLAASGAEGTISIHDVHSGEQRSLCLGPMGPIHDLTFDHSGDRLACAHADGSARIYDVTAIAGPLPFVGHRERVTSIVTDGERVYSGDEAGVLIAWEPSTGRQLWMAHAVRSSIVRIIARPEIGRLALLCNDGTIRWNDIDTGEPLKVERAMTRDGDLRPFGTDMVVSIDTDDAGSQIQWWAHDVDGPTARIITPLVITAGATDDSDTLWCGTNDGALWRFDAGADEPVRLASCGTRITAMQLSSDVIRVGGADGSLRLFERDGTPITSVTAHPTAVIDIIEMHGHDRLITLGQSGRSVRFWELLPTDPIADLQPLPDGVDALLVPPTSTPDHPTLIVGGAAGRVLRIGDVREAPASSTLSAIRARQQTMLDQTGRLEASIITDLHTAATLRVGGRLDESLMVINESIERARALHPTHPMRSVLAHHEWWTRTEPQTGPQPVADTSILGVFEERRLSEQDGFVVYSHEYYEGQHRLIEIEPDFYALEDVYDFRVRIERDDNGTATALLGVYLNEFKDRSVRTDAP